MLPGREARDMQMSTQRRRLARLLHESGKPIAPSYRRHSMCAGDDRDCPQFELHRQKLLDDLDTERRSFLKSAFFATGGAAALTTGGASLVSPPAGPTTAAGGGETNP